MHPSWIILLFILCFQSSTAYVPIHVPSLGRRKTRTNNDNDDNDTAMVVSATTATTSTTTATSAPSRQDLEHAFSETMWKLKVIQEMPDFMTTRPPNLQELFHNCQTAVHTAPSTIPQAGKGLFATQDIPAGSILTFYPVHALGVTFPDGSCFLQSKDKDHDHVESSYVLSLIGDRSIHGICLQKDFQGSHGFVDANPNQEKNDDDDHYHHSWQRAWQCHFINDGAVVQENTHEKIMEYYHDSLQRQNAIFLPLGPAPLYVAVSTKDIRRGDEILTCYGRAYWLGVLEPRPDRWVSMTHEIALVEQHVAKVLEDAMEYLQSEYAQEEADLYQAFQDII